MVKTGRANKVKKTMQLFLFFSFLATCAYTENNQKQATIDNVVEKWVAIARRQYKRDLYEHAEKSLIRALEFQEYLKSEQIELINRLLEKTRKAKFSDINSEEAVKNINLLIEQGKLLEAKGYLGKVLKQKNLGESERQQAIDLDKLLDVKIKEQKTKMAMLYKQSVKYYKNGQYTEAKEGFVIVATSGMYKPLMGKSAEDYLKKIKMRTEQPVQKEIMIESRNNQSNVPVQIPAVVQSYPENNILPYEAPERLAKENIKAEYIRVVVLDAEKRAFYHSGRSEFQQALYVIENAEMTIDKYSQEIDNKTILEYKNSLKILKNEILARKQDWQKDW